MTRENETEKPEEQSLFQDPERRDPVLRCLPVFGRPGG